MDAEESRLFDAWEELDEVIESNQHKVPWILRQKVLAIVERAAEKAESAKVKELGPWLRHKGDCLLIREDEGTISRFCTHCENNVVPHPTYNTENDYLVFRCINSECLAHQMAWSIKFRKPKCTCDLAAKLGEGGALDEM